MKKNILLFFGIIICNLFFAQNSYIQIIGKSNISSFKCINNNINPKSAPIIIKNNPEKPYYPTINLIVKDFSCDNKMMTTEFRKTLDAEKFPNLFLKFILLKEISSNQYLATIEVKMMSKTKIYNVDFNLNNYNLIGKKTVKFSDFGISPPRKMGGLIVVKDDLDLVFSLPTKNNFW